ncbi:MAG: hypothetical protein WCK48_02300 [bacterium]
MVSQELKQKAIELRKLGKSYGFINRETGISSSMLSYWFSNKEWSKKIALKNNKENIKNSTKKIISMNKQRRLNLSEKYKLAEEEATVQFEKFKNDPMFIGALMLYVGEGDKSNNNNSLRIGNIDHSVLGIFIKFLGKYCNIPRENIRFWLLCYPDLDIEKCENWWLEKLDLTRDNLYKTQVIQGKHKTKRLLFGVGNIIISKKTLKIKVLKWIDLMSYELMRA